MAIPKAAPVYREWADATIKVIERSGIRVTDDVKHNRKAILATQHKVILAMRHYTKPKAQPADAPKGHEPPFPKLTPKRFTGINAKYRDALTNVRQEQRRAAIRLPAVAFTVVILVYALGYSVAWVRRGFRS